MQTDRHFFPIVLLTCSIFSLFSCSKSEPIKLGFIGGLSGRNADLSVAGRNGAILAVEDRNAAGGVQGRQVKLLIADDRQDENTARSALLDLFSQRVEAVIGPMTSNMAEVMVPLANDAGILLVSPTVASQRFSGKDDELIRVISGTARHAAKTARYQFTVLGHRTAAVICDMNNASYTESWLSDFSRVFESLGGKVVKVVHYRPGPGELFLGCAQELLEPSADVVVIIGAAVDAALICQQLRKLDGKVNVATAEWASTERFVELGGSAAEGVYSSQFIDQGNTSERYLSFRLRFLRRFGMAPGFSAVAAYDAVTVTLEALESRKPGGSLKRALLDRRSFQCLQQVITVDRFGDADRKTFISVIHNGQYQTVE